MPSKSSVALNSKMIVELLVKKEVLLVTANPKPSVPLILLAIVSGGVVSTISMVWSAVVVSP